MNAGFPVGFALTPYASVLACENPKPSQTKLRVLEYGAYDGEPATKVLLQPLTGKTLDNVILVIVTIFKLFYYGVLCGTYLCICRNI